jgi:hypothetical protein
MRSTPCQARNRRKHPSSGILGFVVFVTLRLIRLPGREPCVRRMSLGKSEFNPMDASNRATKLFELCVQRRGSRHTVIQECDPRSDFRTRTPRSFRFAISNIRALQAAGCGYLEYRIILLEIKAAGSGCPLRRRAPELSVARGCERSASRDSASIPHGGRRNSAAYRDWVRAESWEGPNRRYLKTGRITQ